MLKILYVVGTGSAHDDAELKWSLRSLNRFSLTEVEPVVVGRVPEWFAGESLPCDDPFNRKEKNILRKIVYAASKGLVNGEFQISADDHFWLRPVDLSQLPVYWRQGILPEYRDGNNYEKALDGTRRVLLENGYPAINTTVHCNQWVHTDDFADVYRLLDSAEAVPFAKEYGLVNWAVFPNVGIVKRRRPIRFKHDIKLGDVSAEDLKSVTDSSLIMSINDDAFKSEAFVKYMETEFSGKSRWER